MKYKFALKTILTIGLLTLLTCISKKITPMSIDNGSEKIPLELMPSPLQEYLTAIIFLIVVFAICIYAFVKKKNSILLGLSIFYTAPFSILIFRYKILQDCATEFIWNPYTTLLSGGGYFNEIGPVIPLSIIPLTLLIINLIKAKKANLST